MDAPTPQNQLDFLRNIQRLLGEGLFTATYKYALLLALADVCVERGNDSGAVFPLKTTWLAEKFIAYYWRQSRPYIHPTLEPALPVTDQVLRAASGRQAVVLTLLKPFNDEGRSLFEVQRSASEWRGLVGRVARVVRAMPLWRLQVIGNSPLEFLYGHVGKGDTVELKPGVMYCFRQFHTLITDLVRGAWVRYVRRLNQDMLGSPADLDQFLFGGERASLAAYVPILREVQAGRCFYCQREVKGSDEAAHVDHFIPWSRYPVDLGHNFVFSHGGCNLAKADYLAATGHLRRWTRRNHTAQTFLNERFAQAKIVYDEEGSRRISRWAYQQAAAAQAMTWVQGKQLEPLGSHWMNCLDPSSV